MMSLSTIVNLIANMRAEKVSLISPLIIQNREKKQERNKKVKIYNP
jgi:hypothetical protein